MKHSTSILPFPHPFPFPLCYPYLAAGDRSPKAKGNRQMTRREESIIETLAFGTDVEIEKLKAEGAVIIDKDGAYTVSGKDEEILREVSCTEDDDYDCRKDYVSEDDIARENGFWVDEDGHWRELPDDYDMW